MRIKTKDASLVRLASVIHRAIIGDAADAGLMTFGDVLKHKSAEALAKATKLPASKATKLFNAAQRFAENNGEWLETEQGRLKHPWTNQPFTLDEAGENLRQFVQEVSPDNGDKIEKTETVKREKVSEKTENRKRR